MPADTWTSDQAYEPYVGRWSRRLAPLFLSELPSAPAATWCDVGCGTGALAHAVVASQRPSRVLGVDPSAGFLAAARRTPGPFTAVVATATALPVRDDAVDRVVSALVLNFVPRPDEALAEMRRITRPQGIVAAYVWDYAEGMQLIRLFWDAARAVDPTAADRDEAVRFPLCRPAPLRALFAGAGLADVVVAPVEVATEFTGFDDLWFPFLGGQGPAPGYCAALPDDHRAALRGALHARLPVAPDGSIALRARAWAVRGTAP
jgi:SAM-dependent methyltransferase